MPVLEKSDYRPPFWLKGGHAQTIYPSLFRKLPQLDFRRVRINATDGDFIDLDIFLAGKKPGTTAVILSHGLEGHARRTYMRGMCLAFTALGWDCICRNFRFCGGSINRMPGMYHSGQTEDIHTTVEYALEQGYSRLFLVGFSMGGNQTLKYLGERNTNLNPAIAGAVAFSVPCDLPGAARVLDRPANSIYMRYFMHSLRPKVREKHVLYPDLYPLAGLERMHTFREFDNAYTAPVHGFSSADEYWERAASLPFLHRITVPTLLVNALNDPFLSKECFPYEVARNSEYMYMETPDDGGHVGFTPKKRDGLLYWSETRAVKFVTNIVS